MATSLETANIKWLEKHQELAILMEFPPFSSDYDMKEKFQDAMTSYTGKWMPRFRKAKEGDAAEVSFIEQDVPFAAVEKEFSDQIAEAMLYKKRYGWSPDGRDKALAAYKADSKK